MIDSCGYGSSGVLFGVFFSLLFNCILRLEHISGNISAVLIQQLNFKFGIL